MKHGRLLCSGRTMSSRLHLHIQLVPFLSWLAFVKLVICVLPGQKGSMWVRPVRPILWHNRLRNFNVMFWVRCISLSSWLCVFVEIVTHEWYEVVFWPACVCWTFHLAISLGTSCVLIWTDQLSACTKGFSKRVRSGTSSKRWSVYGSPWVNQDWLRMSRWCAGCSHVYVKSHLSLMGQTPVGSQRSFLPSSWHFLIATLCHGSAERKHNTKTPLETNKSFRDTIYERAILSYA